MSSSKKLQQVSRKKDERTDIKRITRQDATDVAHFLGEFLDDLNVFPATELSHKQIHTALDAVDTLHQYFHQQAQEGLDHASAGN